MVFATSISDADTLGPPLERLGLFAEVGSFDKHS